VFVANRAGVRTLVPELIVAPSFVPQDHLRPWTFCASLHVQYESRIFADDEEVLAFDSHRFVSDRPIHTLRLTDCGCAAYTCTPGL